MPLKPYIESPKVLKCPDGYFCRTIFSLGPYIADYPEQVWLAGAVQDWCPKYIFDVLDKWFCSLKLLQFYLAGVMPNLMTSMLLALIDELMKKQTTSSRTLTPAYYGMSMEFVQILWFINFLLVASPF